MSGEVGGLDMNLQDLSTAHRRPARAYFGTLLLLLLWLFAVHGVLLLLVLVVVYDALLASVLEQLCNPEQSRPPAITTNARHRARIYAVGLEPGICKVGLQLAEVALDALLI